MGFRKVDFRQHSKTRCLSSIFGSELDCDHFQEKLNSLHSTLKFTVEKKPNSSLNFLDVLVEKEALDFLPACKGIRRLMGNTSVGIPLA